MEKQVQLKLLLSIGKKYLVIKLKLIYMCNFGEFEENIGYKMRRGYEVYKV